MSLILPGDESTRAMIRMMIGVLRILKMKNPGDNYYDEYLKHYAREGEKFVDQYTIAIKMAIDEKPKSILEIGTRAGGSICNMLNAYTDYNIIDKIVLVDVWNDGFCTPEVVKMNLRAIAIPETVISGVTFVTGSSEYAMPDMIERQEKFDYILVDGDHSEEAAQRDLDNAAQLVNIGGHIVFDDISEHGCNLRGVWEVWKQAHFHLFDFYENYDGKGVGWARKK